MGNVWVWERDGKWEGGMEDGVVTVSQKLSRYEEPFAVLFTQRTA
jgi:hypothetical protein